MKNLVTKKNGSSRHHSDVHRSGAGFIPHPFVQKGEGFTLIELLIVITIISLLALAVFVALDPLTRFRDSRDSVRRTDVRAMLDAIKTDQVDNGGAYAWSIEAITADSNYMISNTTTTSGCDKGPCDVTIPGASCVNLQPLVTEGYIGAIPVSPNGAATSSWTTTTVGYYMNKASSGVITVGACESENTTSINATR